VGDRWGPDGGNLGDLNSKPAAVHVGQAYNRLQCSMFADMASFVKMKSGINLQSHGLCPSRV